MIRRISIGIAIAAFSILASTWFVTALEAGEGTPENILLQKIFAIAGIGALIVGAVAAIARFDDDPKRHR